MTPTNTFPTRGITTWERVGVYFFFSNSATAIRFLVMSSGGMTDFSSTISSGAVVATMSIRNSMLHSTSPTVIASDIVGRWRIWASPETSEHAQRRLRMSLLVLTMLMRPLWLHRNHKSKAWLLSVRKIFSLWEEGTSHVALRLTVSNWAVARFCKF